MQPKAQLCGYSTDSNRRLFRAVRANQKDLYYLSQLTDRIEDVARAWLGTQTRFSQLTSGQRMITDCLLVFAGPRWLQHWSHELVQGSKFAYFGLTTLLGQQRARRRP